MVAFMPDHHRTRVNVMVCMSRETKDTNPYSTPNLVPSRERGQRACGLKNMKTASDFLPSLSRMPTMFPSLKSAIHWGSSKVTSSPVVVDQDDLCEVRTFHLSSRQPK